MMKFILLVFMMAPLTKSWLIYMNTLMIILVSFLCSNISSFPTSLSYGYGMDVLSFWLIILTIWIIYLMIMSSFKIKYSLNDTEFLFTNLFLLMFLILCFSCTNLFLFYLWFEAIMIPTLVLIFGWGYQPERLEAGVYLLFYMLFASLPMLISIFYIYYNFYTLFYFLIIIDANFFIYISMILAFLIKLPMFLFHFWLPKAHVEAPISGSMILAGVLLKLGGYGLYRVFFFLSFYNYFNYIWIILSLFGSLYISILCLCQVDMKSMIAYSSVAHMGLVISGLMTLNSYGLNGSFILMLGHGLCSSCLFCLANFIYERTHSRSILINKGLLCFMPSMSLLWFMMSINNMSSPPSLNLLGEIFLINSLYSWNWMSSLYLCLILFFSCCYSIYLYSSTQHGVIYSGLKFECYGKYREFMIFILHWAPLNLFFLSSEMMSYWF